MLSDEGGGTVRPYERPVSIHGDQNLGANNVSIFKAELKLVSPPQPPPDRKDPLRDDPLHKVGAGVWIRPAPPCFSPSPRHSRGPFSQRTPMVLQL